MQVRCELHIDGRWAAPEGVPHGNYLKPAMFGQFKTEPKT